jgi:hypothetical protein
LADFILALGAKRTVPGVALGHGSNIGGRERWRSVRNGPGAEMTAPNPEDTRRRLQVGARGAAPHFLNCIKAKAYMRRGATRSNCVGYAQTYPTAKD